MTYILGIETATKMCSVAVSKDGSLLALKEQGGVYSHAENLNNFIQEVLIEANIKLQDIDAIAVSKGPGSYTGLRIGVSTAKGLCYALNKPIISIDTLKVLAKNPKVKLGLSDYTICPMIDARRMEVYTVVFDKQLMPKQPIEAKVIDESSFNVELSAGAVIFIGDGAAKCKEVLGNNENAHFIDNIDPSARDLNELAQDKFLNNEFEDLAYFEPFYLKDFVATTPKKLL